MSQKRPNILYFHVDNISTGDLGCYGGGIAIGARTPNIDRFAEQGLQLTNYNVEAQCTPTRSALMTGRHSTRTGCTSALPGSGLVAWETTIATQLKSLGYRNAILGKWHCGAEPGRYATDHGFDYWYGILGTWDEAMWPDDKFFKASGLEPSYVIESDAPGSARNVKVLDREVRRDIDLELIEKGKRWMADAVDADEPFFLYFNHSNMHFPTLPRAEFIDSSDGGPLADCIQMLDADFGTLLEHLDALGIAEDTIVVFAGDNGRDTTFHAPNNRGAEGNWRGGYFSTYEGNNRTAGILRWPNRLRTGRSDEMIHAVDWFPTILSMVEAPELVPDDRVLDGVDQSAFLRGDEEHSRREHFLMFFDQLLVGMRWRNFKVLTHRVVDGTAPIEQLATPHVYNLTVNPDENTPYNYDQVHSWVLYHVFSRIAGEYQRSLDGDAVPKGAPVDFVPAGAGRDRG
ncbi:sulfatase-like hydrolase/transferase [Agromyces marinus]|uniref:sulfatase-like hydrolase/transferase n=1 Tax=Agromyces marinus TaxID=1389020 RepID=UPI001F355516|nr:sulfatase-like hydrolase/transferase [Agromyces marinus]UIP59948.1 N-acetylgalactosamine-6-O-sulfatase [Agromyces marinus]